MFVSHFKQIVLILTIGIGLGTLVPIVMQQLPVTSTNERTEFINDPTYTEDVLIEENFHVQVQDGILSVLQGESPAGQVILSGLNIQHWPKEMQSMVTQVEFHSLDEVQSFIDSMTEELWIE